MVRFEELYREHFAFVWRLARALGVPEAEVDDVVHDVFIVVGRKLTSFDASRSARAWIGGITRNAVMHQRRASARRFRKIAAAPAPRSPISPDLAFEHREALRLMDTFLRGIPEEYRDVFVLMQIEGLSAPESAPILGISQAKLYARLRVARTRFERFVVDLAKESSDGTRRA